MDILLVLHLLNALLMIAMPVALGIYLTRRWHMGWRLWLIGGAVFVLSQVLHIPFNSLVLNPLLKAAGVTQHAQGAQLALAAVALGLSAGLFEEFANYAMFRWWVPDARSWRKGVMAGAGHGGIEAVILGCLALYGLVQLVALRDMDLAKVLPPAAVDATRQVMQQYWSAPWWATIAGSFERLFTIPCQIAFSLLVLQTFTRHQWWWVWLAVGWHALVDAAAVYASATIGPYPTELVVAAAGLISIAMIFLLRTAEPQPNAPVEEPSLAQAPIEPLPLAMPTAENLERSRYL